MVNKINFYLESKRFLYCETADKQIILLDVAWNSSQRVCIDSCAVQIPLPEEFEFAHSAESQAVEKSRFTGATGSQNG